MISVVLSKPVLDKRTTQDRRTRQTDGRGKVKLPSISALTQFIALKLIESAPTVYGIASTYKGQLIYNVTVSDALKPANTLSTLFTAAPTRQTLLQVLNQMFSLACCVNSPGIFSRLWAEQTLSCL